MTHQITKGEVLARWADGPRWTLDSDEEAFFGFYTEPVDAFGLTVRHDEHPGMKSWVASGDELPASTRVPMDRILYSTQAEGVLLSVLAQVITEGTSSAPCDPEGWYDNQHPLLFEWPDGTYSIRDGNHRCIGGRLRGDTHINAHVINHDYV